MPEFDQTKVVAFIAMITLAACVEPGDLGLQSACESNIFAAERELKVAKANKIGGAIDWAKAATLIAAARTQKQFNEFQSCLIKAKGAQEILAHEIDGNRR